MSLTGENVVQPRPLNDRIRCSERVLQSLLPETIEICNQIVSELNAYEDDQALVVQVTNFPAIHVALGLPACPARLQQGANADISFINFRDWLIEGAHGSQFGVSAEHQVGGPLSTCWHHLSSEQFYDIASCQWQNREWIIAIRAAGPTIPGPLCLVLRLSSCTDFGWADLFEMPQVFG